MLRSTWLSAARCITPSIFSQGENCIEIAYIGLYEPVIGLVLYISQIGKIAGIGKLVQIYDSIFRIFPY